jgi:hypothetical protein
VECFRDTLLCSVNKKGTLMITKFDGIPGNNLASLLTFIHSDGNRVSIPLKEGEPMIVRIKSVSPDNQGGGTWYGLTLEILEWLPKGDEPGQNRVDKKYLMKVYEILGQNRLTECVSADKPRRSTCNWPPISPGTSVKTTQENRTITDWTSEAQASRQWGVRGEIVTHHDSHGLSYEVKHLDGSIGHYDPTEFEVV